jgi:shikimate kinase
VSGHLLLVGMMGSGKTTVGRLLARRLGRPFFDSDDEVVQATGRTIPEIFESDGEAAFRAEERRALQAAVASPTPVVVAVAGGAVLDPRNRALLQRAGTVVWLRADPGTLAGRVGDGTGRPLLGDDPPAALRRLAAERTPLYEQVADVVVDVEGAAPAAVVEEVLAAVGDVP